MLLIAACTVVDARNPFFKESSKRHCPVTNRFVKILTPIVYPFLIAAVTPVSYLRIGAHHTDSGIVGNEFISLICIFSERVIFCRRRISVSFYNKFLTLSRAKILNKLERRFLFATVCRNGITTLSAELTGLVLTAVPFTTFT